MSNDAPHYEYGWLCPPGSADDVGGEKPRMTQGDALLAAILNDPADDFVRLVFADYLEETGCRSNWIA